VVVLKYTPIDDNSGESFNMLLYYQDGGATGVSKAFKLPVLIRSIPATKYFTGSSNTEIFAYLGPKES